MSEQSGKQPAFELSWLGGILGMVVFVAIGAGWMAVSGGGWAVGGVSILISLAAFASGSLLGFLFGVPRVLARAESTPPAGGDAQPDSARKRLLQSNTNLERISDWLTTMLVGVGLTQVLAVPGAISKFYGFLAQSGIGCPAMGACRSEVLAFTGSSLMVVGVLCGFLFMYLYTRLMLTNLFQKTEELLDGTPLESEEAAQIVKEAATTIVKQSADAAGGSMELRTIAQKTKPSVEDALAVMLEALYRPDGYKEVIRIGEELQRTPVADRADYWFYLAAAYGQAHRDATTASEREGLRKKVLDSAQKAIARSPSYRGRLASLTQSSNFDNDLQDFANDPEFLQIIGKSS